MEMDRTGFLCSHSIKNATVYFKSFESESCGKQFFEGKNMIGNIFEKKDIVGKFEKSDIYEDLSHQNARKSYRRVTMWCH